MLAWARDILALAGWRAWWRVALLALAMLVGTLVSAWPGRARADDGPAPRTSSEAVPQGLPSVLAPFIGELLESDGYVSDEEAALLPYQRAWAYDRSRVKVCVKSRRIGITWATAYEAVEVASSKRADGGMDVWYQANSLDDAREFIDDCADWVRWIRPLVEGIASTGDVSDEVLIFGDEKILAFTITFASGFKIHALTSKPRRLRGKQGLAILDEAAFHDNLAEWLKAALPFLTWGGRVAVISTLNGVENEFHDLVEDCRKKKRKYTLHQYDIHKAVSQGLYRRICRKLGLQWTHDSDREWIEQLRDDNGDGFEEEYECIPRRSGGAYIPQHLIHGRMVLGDDQCPVVEFAPKRNLDKSTWGTDNWDDVAVEQRRREMRRWLDAYVGPLLKELRDVELYGGVDFGRVANLTVVTLLELQRDMGRRTRLVIELDKVPFDQQDQVLDYLWERLTAIRKVYLDATGIGKPPAEHARDRLGGRAEMINLSEGWYADHWPPLKRRFEDGAIELPTYQPLFEDLRSLRRVGGKVKVVGEGKGHSNQKRHGDGAISLLLAEAAVGTKAEAANTDPVSRWRGPKRRRRR